MTRYHVEIGDKYNDGHGQWEKFYVESSASPEEIKDAVTAAKKTHSKEWWPESMCNQYEDSMATHEVATMINEQGWDTDEYYAAHTEDLCGEELGYAHDGDFSFTPFGYAYYAVWFIKQGNPSLDIKMVKDSTIPLPIYLTGYGLFSS